MKGFQNKFNQSYYYLFIALLLSPVNTVFAKSISAIDITGLSVISRGTVLSHIPVESGDEIYSSTSNNIIKSLYRTGLFQDVSVLEDNGVIKINLLEKPHIYRIDVNGYSDKVVQKKQLDRLLKSIRLTQGEVFNQKTLDKLMTQLKATYKKRGYYLTKISSKIQTDKQNRITIDIDIEENDLIKVNSMKISGASVFTQQELLNEFNIGEADFFILNFFTERDHYSKTELEVGLKKIQALYENSGYIDFNVSSAKAQISEDKKQIDIHITIFEGRPYKIGKIRFSGDSLYYSSRDIEDRITFKSGQIFSQKSLVKSAKNIADFYTKQGYAFVNVSPLTKQNVIKKSVDIEVSIKLSQRVYINRILIEGNSVTKDEVIRREIIQTEGGIYSSEQVEKSISNLKRLGYFSDVNIQVEKINQHENKINLIFTVVETKTGNFSIGLSHSNETGIAINFGISEKNFLGSGNTLMVDFIQSDSIKKYAFSFTDPHFNDQGDSLSYGVSYNELDASNLDISNYQISTVGAHIGYGIPLDEHTQFSTTIDIADHDIDCGSDFINLEPIITSQCLENQEIKLLTTWKENSLNNFYNPSAGQRITTSIDIALPIGDFQYVRFNIKHEAYTSLSDKLVLKVNYKAGIAKGYNDKDLPFFRRYYGGGQNSIRGFKFNTLGDKYSTGRAKGGEVEFASSIAVISPIPFVKDSKNMRISAFIDAGSIYDKVSDIKVDDIRVSTGIAFSWLTALGPIGISYGFPLIKKANDQIDEFNFNLGSNF